MTNKPMLSVDRELLERAVSAVIVARGPGSPTERDLRAILDKPAECRCKRYGKDNPHWPCPVHAEPAAQHQGEPVACMIRSRNLIAQASIAVDGKDHFSAWSEWAPNSIEYGRAVTDPIRNNPVCYEMELLFKERPAPLKIGSGVTVENIGFGTEHERKPYLVFDGAGCLTEVNLIDVSLVSKRRTYSISELNEVGVRVEQPAPVPDSRVDNGITYPNGHSRPAYCAAPVAVVMPERKVDPGMIAGLTSRWVQGWNEALDEVARLNGVKL